LVLADAGLHYINDHKGHPRQDFLLQEAANPQPPFQVIESRQIGKRRLDVWKPIPAAPSTSVTQPTKQTLSITQTPWKTPSIRLQPVDAVPKRTYFQLAPLSTPQPEVLAKQGLNVQQAPLLKPQNVPLFEAVSSQGLENVRPPRPRVNLPQTRVDKRPRYPQVLKRPGPLVPKRSDHPTPKRPELQLPKRADPLVPKRQDSPVPRRPDTQVPKRPVSAVPKRPVSPVPKKPDRLVPKRPDHSGPSRPDQPIPRRPTPRLPPPPQNSFSPPNLGAQLARKPVLRGFPPRKGLQTPAQDRRDTSPVAHFTYKAASSALTIGKPLLLKQANGRPTKKSDNSDNDTRDFEDLLFHLGMYSEDDDYIPTKSKPAKIKPTKVEPSKAKIAEAKPSEAKPTKPSKRPKRKITLPPKPKRKITLPPKPKRKINFPPQRPKPPSPPLSQKPPTTTESPNQTTQREKINQEEETVAVPLFPQLYKQDVMNALDAVDKSIQPLFHAASVITSSLSLDATRRQTVEDVFEKASDERLDTVADTIQFTMDQVLAKPEPFIVISAILLSVITGTAIGSSLTTVRTATRIINNDSTDTKIKDGLCPDGYEIVWIGEDGLEDILGRIGHLRMRRDMSDDQETERSPARRGYPFRQAAPQTIEEEEEQSTYGAGHYCRKKKATTTTRDSTSTGGSAHGVGIKVNSHGNDKHSGSSGQVSIKVGGVSINVGGDDRPAARADVEELPKTSVREESRIHETHHQEEEMDEISGVLDGAKYVIMDSLRQIRSLLAG